MLPGQISDSVGLVTDGDADFLLRSMQTNGGIGGNGVLYSKHRRADDSYWQSDFSDIYNLQQAAGEAWLGPNFPQLVYPKSSTIKVDVKNDATNGQNPDFAVFIYNGVKLYPDGAISSVPYPDRYKEFPWGTNVPLTVAAGKKIFDVVVGVKENSTAVIRGLIQASGFGPFGTGSAERGRCKDQWGHHYSDDWIELCLLLRSQAEWPRSAGTGLL